MTSIVERTVYASLIAQILTTLFGVIALFKELDFKDQVLNGILSLEMLVQFIEAVFYAWFAFFFTRSLSRNDIAKYRYYDWIFTTPMMLLSTSLFFVYQAGKTSGNPLYSIRDFLRQYGWDYGLMAFYNMLMLVFGYLNEVGVLSLLSSSLFGFLFFGLSFMKLYEFAVMSPDNMGVFWLMFSIWFLYGVFATYPNIIKNTGYNVLDIFSKNFYGVYLTWRILSLP